MKIELKPIKYQLEVPGYGSFEVSPLGAGAEAEVRMASRKLDEATEKLKDFDGFIEKEKNGEDIDKEAEDYKACMRAYQEAGDAVDVLRDTLYEKLRAVFKGEKVEQLFNDFTYDQIASLHRQVTKENKDV